MTQKPTMKVRVVDDGKGNIKVMHNNRVLKEWEYPGPHALGLANVAAGGFAEGWNACNARWEKIVAPHLALAEAAPDLLEQLQIAFDIIDKHVPRESLGMAPMISGAGNYPILQKHLLTMHKAIAKAKGETDA